MTNNDVLRRLRYTFDYSDKKMLAIFAAADTEVTLAQLRSWLKKDDEEGYKNCSDKQLAIFLNGLINDRRGKRDGEQPQPETKLTNNLVLVKLKIALNLKAEDMLAILALANFKLSKHALSALFRKPGHKHYRDCKDQILRNFLQGLQQQHRPAVASEPRSDFQWKPFKK
jgi:uncharacterized protein YehS (DUF1456 family)